MATTSSGSATPSQKLSVASEADKPGDMAPAIKNAFGTTIHETTNWLAALSIDAIRGTSRPGGRAWKRGKANLPKARLNSNPTQNHPFPNPPAAFPPANSAGELPSSAKQSSKLPFSGRTELPTAPKKEKGKLSKPEPPGVGRFGQPDSVPTSITDEASLNTPHKRLGRSNASVERDGLKERFPPTAPEHSPTSNEGNEAPEDPRVIQLRAEVLETQKKRDNTQNVIHRPKLLAEIGSLTSELNAILATPTPSSSAAYNAYLIQEPEDEWESIHQGGREYYFDDDEDENAENYYKNDYPSDDNSDSSDDRYDAQRNVDSEGTNHYFCGPASRKDSVPEITRPTTERSVGGTIQPTDILPDLTNLLKDLSVGPLGGKAAHPKDRSSNLPQLTVKLSIGKPGAKKANPKSSLETQKIKPYKKVTSFLILPLELREKIYTSVFDDLPTRLIVDHTTKLSQLAISPRTLPSIAFTSKTVWQEAVLAYLRRTRFVVAGSRSFRGGDPHTKLVNWLSTFPNEQGFQAIRMLSYHQNLHLQTSNRSSVRTMFPRYSGLRSFILEIDAFSLTEFKAKPRVPSDNDDDSGSLFESAGRTGYERRVCSGEELKERFKFEALFTMRNLGYFKIIFTGCILFERIAFTREEGCKNFITMINTGFLKRGDAVQVVFEYEGE